MVQMSSMHGLSGIRPARGLWRAFSAHISGRKLFHTSSKTKTHTKGCPRALFKVRGSSSASSMPGTSPQTVEQHAAPGLQLYNTMSRQKQLFAPREDQGNRVSMYVCGVTVYDYSHIGHARVYVAFDVLYRFLQHLRYDVTYVRNFTDVDDKIINRANASGEDPLHLSHRFIHEFHVDMAALNCLPPTLEPKATEYIPQMVNMIQDIISNGHAYVAGGDVYFDVGSLPGYGKLSGRAQEDNRAGERVAVDERKRGAADFALWKAAKPGEPTWDSPWGPGRPGWHIECSAMIREVMGKVIDIHGGGRDLVFPHHENELAQSRAAVGGCGCGQDHDATAHTATPGSSSDEFVRYWVHNGFVNVDSEKMSKSLGNFFTIREVLKQYHPAALRWFLVNTQYRQPVNYTQRALEEASDRLYYLYQTIVDTQEALAGIPEGEQLMQRAQQALPLAFGANMNKSSDTAESGDGAGPSNGSGNGGKGTSKGGGAAGKAKQPGDWEGEAGDHGRELVREVVLALSDDLNTPVAVAALSAPLKLMNDLLHTKKGKKQAGRLQALASCQVALQSTLGLLGLWVEQPQQLLRELRQLALVRAGMSEEEVSAAIQERAAARAAKDYAASDAVRTRLEAAGILIMDTPQGTSWKPGPRLHIAAEEATVSEPAIQ